MPLYDFIFADIHLILYCLGFAILIIVALRCLTVLIQLTKTGNNVFRHATF